VAQQAVSSRWLRVDILDVGHGDAIVVRTPAGHVLLVDAGTHDAGRLQVVPFLRSQGISTLDALVLTHPDEDHIGGAVPVLEQMRVLAVLTNGVTDDTMSARTVQRLIAQQRIPHTVLAKGSRLAGTGVDINVLHPPAGLVPGVPPESNDNAVVMRVGYGDRSVLLTADLEEAGIPIMLQQQAVGRASVLKVPHHGSRLGPAGAWLFEAVRPEISVISVGRLHHLPAQATVDSLARTGTTIYSTREAGAVSVRTDGGALDISCFRGCHP
jgi:competence protein ComEC